MRPPHRLLRPLVAVLTLSLMVVVSGCSGDNPSYAPAPQPGAEASPGEPLFASDEEALEAAADAYRAYYAVSDRILDDGGENPERLIGLVSEPIYEFEADGYERFVTQKYRSVGATTIDSFVLQQYSAVAAKDEALITIYACIDISATNVLDENNESVVLPDRQNRFAYEASFSAQADGSMPLILTEEELWTGADFCV
jgi:hypothetical protein